MCKFIPLTSIIKSARFAGGCPAIAKFNFHAYSGGGKLILALSLLEGRIGPSRKLAEIIYSCTLCGLCDHSCKIGTDIEVLEILHELRCYLVESGYGPLEEHKRIIESIKTYGNVWLQPRSRRERWAQKEGVKILKDGERAEVLYYVGCTYSFDPVWQRVAVNTARILKSAGVNFGVLGSEEVCCFSPAYRVGEKEIFKKIATENIEKFNSLGVEKVVTSCAGCYSTFKSEYSKLGIKMNFEVLHTSQLFHGLWKKGRVKLHQKDMNVTYHDPCHIGRLGELRVPSSGREKYVLNTMPVKEIKKTMGEKGIYEEPREILKAITNGKLKEMERVREYSWCCGAGGGVKSGVPELADFAAGERIEEARFTGADAIITCCPWCEKNFEDALKRRGEKLKVLDITDLMVEERI